MNKKTQDFLTHTNTQLNIKICASCVYGHIMHIHRSPKKNHHSTAHINVRIFLHFVFISGSSVCALFFLNCATVFISIYFHLELTQISFHFLNVMCALLLSHKNFILKKFLALQFLF